MPINVGPVSNIKDLFHAEPLKTIHALENAVTEAVARDEVISKSITVYQQTQAQFTDLLTQAMGYFVTEVPQLDGSTIHYEHDNPLLAESIVIYKKTATTMSWTPDAGAHWYGMDDEGNILARKIAATDISAERITISGASTFSDGYDPSTKETPAGAQAKADAAYASAQSFANSLASGLQTQIDGSITTFFYAYVPLLTNVPANAWTTTAIKNQHLGDLFYDTSTGYSYRYQLVSTTYSWQRITDTDITTALAKAATAQDTADHKRRVFVATPTTPYDIGDLWAGGSAGDLKKCSTARASGAYVAGDWTLASKYTDDTAATNAATVAAAKNKTFFTQPAPPYYIGDIWQKQQVPVAVTDIVKCTVTRLTGVYTAADWANAYTLAEIAAMGTTVITGGKINTSLLTANNIINGKMQSVDGKTYFDLDNSKILETAVIDGHTITVEMSAAKPFELSIDGRPQIYVKNGILITSIYDVNEDGYVDETDLDIVVSYILSSDPVFKANLLAQYPKMDVNQSGTISSSDLTLISRACHPDVVSSGSSGNTKWQKRRDGTMDVWGWNWIQGTNYPLIDKAQLWGTPLYATPETMQVSLLGWYGAEPTTIQQAQGLGVGEFGTAQAINPDINGCTIRLSNHAQFNSTAWYIYSFFVRGRWKA